MAKVYLTGAGPGDPALLTLKAKQALAKSDVILYDRLANQRFLDYASETAEKIYVGKKAADHRYTQSEIESLMLAKVEAGKTVCRLKGGDPFVYGRGGEEALRLAELGIDFEIIPGISSALAVPLYAGIPLTQRHLASSFAVITGHEAAAKSSSTVKIEEIAAAVDTLVVLMGVGKLAKIVERVIAAGRDPETPIALIRWGSRSQQQVIKGKLANIVVKVKTDKLKPPAVIIIGEVVRLREQLNWFEKKQLLARNILVTRPAEQAAEFVELIESEGGQAILAPAIKIKEAANPLPLKKAIRELTAYNFIIFTSVNGVEFFWQELQQAGLDARAFAGHKIICIGSKTAKKLAEFGLQADYLPADYSTAGILNLLENLAAAGEINFAESNFLLPRANLASRDLADQLMNWGAAVTDLTAYQTVPAELPTDLIKLIKNNQLDLLTFTSSSTVSNFMNGIKNLAAVETDLEDLMLKLQEIPVICIGPVTAASARQEGLAVNLIAEEYTINGLFKAIINYFTKLE